MTVLQFEMEMEREFKKKNRKKCIYKKKMRECFGILKLVQKSNFSMDLCDAQTERMICNKNRN